MSRGFKRLTGKITCAKYSARFCVLLTMLLRTAPAPADVIVVPDDYARIQMALSHVQSGDTVQVRAGNWTGPLVFPPLDISLLSECGNEVTTIDAGEIGPVISLQEGHTRATVIAGFTLQHGATGETSDGYGGGIHCIGSSPVIRNNRIRYNDAEYGGGIAVLFGAPRIFDNEIAENTAHLGGGIYVYQGEAEIQGNLIRENSAIDQGFGGGTYLSSCNQELTENIFWRNTGFVGGALSWRHSSVNLLCNTLVENSGESGAACDIYNSTGLVQQNILAWQRDGEALSCLYSLLEIRCNDLYGNEFGDDYCGEDAGGNFSADPMFCDIYSGDLRLESGSPCWTGECGVIGAISVDCDGEGVRQPGKQTIPKLSELLAAPNPFNMETTITWTLDKPLPLQLLVYNILGQQQSIRQLGTLPAGRHRLTLNGSELAAGIYIVSLVPQNGITAGRSLRVVYLP